MSKKIYKAIVLLTKTYGIKNTKTTKANRRILRKFDANTIQLLELQSEDRIIHRTRLEPNYFHNRQISGRVGNDC